MAEKEAVLEEPKISEFILSAKLLGTMAEIGQRASSLNLFEVRQENDSLILIDVESRDIQKNPYLFFIFTLKSTSLSIQYSIAKDTSERIRHLFIMKTLAGLLSLIYDVYQVDGKNFYQHIDSSIDSVLQSLSQSYSTLFGNYDSLLNDYRETKRLNIELTNSNKALVSRSSALNDENEQLKSRLKELESYSDQSLMVMIEEWIESHGNTIDLEEFSKTKRIPQPRVEQILNKMVSLRYIELKG